MTMESLETNVEAVMSSEDASVRYRVPPTLDLRWRRWDDDWIVYHPWTGDTHVLTLAAGEALRRLQVGPTDAATLATHVAEALRIDADAQLERHLVDLLVDLHRRSLIEPEPAHESESH